MATQLDIARRCRIDVSTVNKILRRISGLRFRNETVKAVFKAARELGYPFEQLRFAHRRSHARRQVNAAVLLTVYGPDGSVLDHGQATLRELSLSGAALRWVVLSKESLPLAPHTIGIRLSAGGNGEGELRGRAVRLFDEGGSLGFSLAFTDPDRARRWVRTIP